MREMHVGSIQQHNLSKSTCSRAMAQETTEHINTKGDSNASPIKADSAVISYCMKVGRMRGESKTI